MKRIPRGMEWFTLVGRPLLYEFVIAVGLIKPRVAKQIVVASYFVHPCVHPFGSVIFAP